mmetsp:Transcript_28003/g.80305  ORF Transcript_28003/g.80305 Transcript_28003/m.80305 type:complete len:327 (-) Transcript_28003:134-1114(-)
MPHHAVDLQHVCQDAQRGIVIETADADLVAVGDNALVARDFGAEEVSFANLAYLATSPHDAALAVLDDTQPLATQGHHVATAVELASDCSHQAVELQSTGAANCCVRLAHPTPAGQQGLDTGPDFLLLGLQCGNAGSVAVRRRGQARAELRPSGLGQLQEDLVFHDEERHIRCRHNAHWADDPQQQRDLPEGIPGAQLGDLYAVAEDLARACADGEEGRSCARLPHNHVILQTLLARKLRSPFCALAIIKAAQSLHGSNGGKQGHSCSCLGRSKQGQPRLVPFHDLAVGFTGRHQRRLHGRRHARQPLGQHLQEAEQLPFDQKGQF